MTFLVSTVGKDSLGLAAKLQEFANQQWVPAHYDKEEAAAFVLGQFKRTVATELELLYVEANH